MNRKQTNYTLLLFVFIALYLTGCGSRETLRGVFKNETPYERYASSLQSAKLHESALGQDWTTAGQTALQNPTPVMLPFKETGYLPADKPRALGYTVQAQRGQRIVVQLEVKSRQGMQVFMELFEIGSNGAARHLTFADSAALALSFEAEDNLAYLIRVQPELLRGGSYTITMQAGPTLAFPIPGKTSRNISSAWGDPRDAGARRHEGIDIFAPRGTPVVASTDGVVSRVGETTRGGKVVWISDRNRGQNLYYAHLDQQLVTTGQRVAAGDTLGLVGNTGNAKGTAPHLHFGIYRYGRGATNPYPYVHQNTSPIPPVKVDATHIGNWVRVKAKNANLRVQPTTKAAVYAALSRHTPLRVTGAADNWYRVQLPDQREAYVMSTLVEGIAKPIAVKKLKEERPLLDDAHLDAGELDSLPAGAAIPVVAVNGAFELVRQSDGQLGWIQAAD